MKPKIAVSLGVVALLFVAAPLVVTATDSFVDVPESNVHHDNVAWLAETGVTRGCNPPSNTEFCPGEPVSRQQMASFLRRLAEGKVVDAATAEDAAALGGQPPSHYETVVASAFCGPNESFTTTSCGPPGGIFPGETTHQLLEVDVEAPAAGMLEIAGRAQINLAGALHLFWVTVDEACAEFSGSILPIFQQAPNLLVFETDSTTGSVGASTLYPVPSGDHTLRLCGLRPDPADAEMLAAELSAIWTPGGEHTLEPQSEGGPGIEIPSLEG